MNQKRKRLLSVFIAIVMLLSIVQPTGSLAKSKIRLSKTKITMKVGNKRKLKVYGTKKKVKWSSKNKKIATVKSGTVTARKIGKTTIIAKVAGKTLKCKVVVNKDEEEEKSDGNTEKNIPDSIITNTTTVEPVQPTIAAAISQEPTSTSEPSAAPSRIPDGVENRIILSDGTYWNTLSNTITSGVYSYPSRSEVSIP